MEGIVEGRVTWWIRGICPMMSSNGAFFVVVLGHELCAYCAIGSRDAQLF